MLDCLYRVFFTKSALCVSLSRSKPESLTACLNLANQATHAACIFAEAIFLRSAIAA